MTMDRNKTCGEDRGERHGKRYKTHIVILIHVYMCLK